MSPFSGEGLNLAFPDAADLAAALRSTAMVDVAAFEERMASRAHEAAEGAAAGFGKRFSDEGPAPVLENYRELMAEMNG